MTKTTPLPSRVWIDSTSWRTCAGLAMLPPGSPALDREQATKLVRELQDAAAQLRWLRDGLRQLLADYRA